jgi:acyl-coenzyme A thioesterase PaaI-like protein
MSRVQLEQVLRTVPFISSLGIAVEEARPGQVVLRVPAASGNLSHGGVMHSGALFTVGELAAGVALGTHPRLASLTKLQKATRIEYIGTSGKDVTAHAMVTAEMITAIHNGLEREGRATVEVPVQLMDGHGKDVGEVVSVFTFKR